MCRVQGRAVLSVFCMRLISEEFCSGPKLGLIVGLRIRL
jgi:hypothetical protein